MSRSAGGPWHGQFSHVGLGLGQLGRVWAKERAHQGRCRGQGTHSPHRSTANSLSPHSKDSILNLNSQRMHFPNYRFISRCINIIALVKVLTLHFKTTHQNYRLISPFPFLLLIEVPQRRQVSTKMLAKNGWLISLFMEK